MKKLTKLEHDSTVLRVNYMESMQVREGVVCDVYEFIDDNSRDLGVIRVNTGMSTPRQRVLEGDKTIEGYMTGKGTLIVEGVDGEVQEYTFPGSANEVTINVGEIMQWKADKDLTFYEICYPPYIDGRFQNLD